MEETTFKGVRTRMAPSPTGEYHIGHIRTLLYNIAYARKHGGKFIVRIEDTDRTRFVPDATEKILDVIRDYGFSWDEGPEAEGKFGPYVQSERLNLYKKYALELVEKKHAYYCFCTSERLAELREVQQKQGVSATRYDRACLKLSQTEIEQKLASNTPYVIRLKVPENEEISFHDEILGDITFNSSDIDDQVLLKSDGYPTYHLAVVVDDHLMGVTHIMRGTDWVPSTPKHVLLYRAFGWKMPITAHLPNIKEKGANKKLSKRFGPVSARKFLEEGYLVPALVNFLMFLGWNPGTEKEIYTLEEFVQDFDTKKIQHTDLVAFDRDKLLWLNGIYIRQLTDSQLWEEVTKWAQKYNVALLSSAKNDEFNIKVISLIKERLKVLKEFSELTEFFYIRPSVDISMTVSYAGNEATAKEIITNFAGEYERVSEGDWNTEYLDKYSHELLEKYGYKPKEAFMTLRVFLTGKTATPPLFDVLSLLGKDQTLERLKI